MCVCLYVCGGVLLCCWVVEGCVLGVERQQITNNEAPGCNLKLCTCMQSSISMLLLYIAAAAACPSSSPPQDLVSRCDVVTINCPLHASTKGLFKKKLMAKMKKGAYLVNTARGEHNIEQIVICGAVHLAVFGCAVW